MSIPDELEKLHKLKESGAISEDEYEKAKKDLLAKNQPMGERVKETVGDIPSNTWAMFIHFSKLCGYIIPVVGFVVPIILWQIKKDEMPDIDKHGRIVTNWIITEIILGFIFWLLTFILIGIPLLIVLLILGIVFPIIGGIKANDGEAWKYPCSIPFFPLDESK